MRDSLRKYLAAATLLVLPIIAACGEDVMPPPPTGSIVGQVSIEGMGVDGISVSLSNGASTATAGGGNYRFDNVEQGSYTVTISGYPADASFDATSAPASIGDTGGTVTVDFRGTYIRTAAIMGTVTVEKMGLPGVTVRLSGMADAEMTTDNDGVYKFDALRGGTYSVEISGFPDTEVSFSSTSGAATVGVGETKVVSFDGTYVRTAGIQGQVSVDGEGLPGVRVTLLGEGEDRSETTNASGQYSFANLKKGTYQVGITNPDPDDYEFLVTSKSQTIATGEVANVPFEGTLLRTAGIAGRVSLDDGMGLDDVTVTLAGAAEATTMTKNGGQYSFAGLAAGTYVLSITNPDPVAYNFAEDQLQRTVVLADDQSAIENFEGTHTRTASISGVLFIDEVVPNKEHNEGEPSITAAIAPLVAAGALDAEVVAGLLAKAKVKMRGPDLADPPVDIAIMPDGTFSTGDALMAGSYQLELPVNDDDVAAGLAAAGVAFVGESEVVTVAAGGSEMVNFPFRITMQTISVGAVMGNREEITDPPLPVSDVDLELYPTAEDAEDGTNMLGEGTTAGLMDEGGIPGMAVFSFARAEDTNPAGDATDNLVFVKVVGHHDDLSVSDNPIIEIEYPGVSRLHAAPAHVRLLNTAVRFQFWVKSDMEARSGDMPLEGWHTLVFMGEITDDSEPLMKPDPEDATKMVNLTDPTEGDEEDDEELGRAMVSYSVDTDDLPAVFTVVVTPDSDDFAQPMAKGETWEEVGDDRLMHIHTGFELPALNTHEANDLMATYVTFTTQKLTVGAYREADDEPGFTDFQSRVSEGDHRPAAGVGLEVSVMVEATGRRGLEVYDAWDHDDDPDTDPIDATLALSGGMATFGNLPADMDFTVQFNEGSNRVAVGGPDSRSDRVQTFGADLELGTSVGAFGDMSGAGPEVKLCPLTTDMRPSSLGDDDSDCATFAYQWNTGTIEGSLDRDIEDLDVDIEAETDVHSEAPRPTETDDDGEFSVSGVQDGVYTVTMASSDDYRVVPDDGVRVSVYHDETDDDDPDDNIFGNPDTGTADFSATRLRLSIRGYAANISHETNDVVRGDETYEDAELELYAYNPNAAATVKIKKTGPVLATTMVGADGLYSFDDLDDDGTYVIVAKNTDDYEMLTTGPDVYYINNVPAQVYGDPGEASLTLPYWDYMESEGMQLASGPHPLDPTNAASPTYTFRNFALLHGDGEFSGRVVEARRDPGGIAVELRRCLTYTAFDDNDTPGDDTDDTAESCREEVAFDAQSTSASGSGRWDITSLREGYYVANIAATTYNRAKWDATNGIDDDADNCEGTAGADANCDQVRTTDMYGLLEGKRAFNRGGATFYVYNRTLDADADASDLEIKGTDASSQATINAGEVTLSTLPAGDVADGAGPGNSLHTITWASGGIKITPDIPANATFEVEVEAPIGTGGADVTVSGASGGDGDEVTLALGAHRTSTTDGSNAGDVENTVSVRVVAQNGYNDTNFSFIVTRTAPVDAQVDVGSGGLTVGTTRAGTDGVFAPALAGAEDEYTVTVPPGGGTGNTMSAYIRVFQKAGQGDLTVMHNGNAVDRMAALGGQSAQAHDYRITIARTGSLQGQRVTITNTSEDGREFTIEVALHR